VILNNDENVFDDKVSSNEENTVNTEMVTELALAILEYYKVMNIDICDQN
jgi:hypothetical protein